MTLSSTVLQIEVKTYILRMLFAKAVHTRKTGLQTAVTRQKAFNHVAFIMQEMYVIINNKHQPISDECMTKECHVFFIHIDSYGKENACLNKF